MYERVVTALFCRTQRNVVDMRSATCVLLWAQRSCNAVGLHGATLLGPPAAYDLNILMHVPMERLRTGAEVRQRVKQLIHLDLAADSALESAWRPHTTTRIEGVSSVARADENGKAVRLDMS